MAQREGRTMNTSIMEDASVPAMVEAVRDASKAVGSKLAGPVHKLHVPAHVSALQLPERKRRHSTRNFALLGGLGLLLVCAAMLRRRNREPIE